MKNDPVESVIPTREPDISPEALVGQRLRALRTKRGLSMRALADRSGLNINTLNMAENGKTSPSVSTLHQLARALEVPISALFELEPVEKRIVFTPADRRPLAAFGATQAENLGKDLCENTVQPFIVTLEPGIGSGDRMIVHTGHEFIYCISGTFKYQVEDHEYILSPGDSLVFESHLPHRWENNGSENAQFLLTLVPAHQKEEPALRHFSARPTKKELNMKLALITDDGQTISRHFGRAPYYLVLTIEEGKIVNREMREKMGHNHFANQPHQEEAHGAGHGMDSVSHNKHVSMAEAISDCQAIICGGMGMGAYESMRRLNIQPVVTELQDIEEAVQAYIDGKLVDQTDLLH